IGTLPGVHFGRLRNPVDDGDRMLELLVTAAPELAPDVARRGDAIRAALQAAIDGARATWPDLATPTAAFVAAIGAGVREADDVAAASAEPAPAALSLGTACAPGARAALDAFATRCDRVIAACLRGFGHRGDAIDEIAQEIRAKLFVAADGPPKIATYSG